MIKILPTTLNTHRDTHRLCYYVLETLATFVSDKFEPCDSLAACDCVLTNAPAAPPYCFDAKAAEEIVKAGKPIIVINDADGGPPDCERQTPDSQINFCNFVRAGSGIRAYFYREWFLGYERPDLPFPMVPFELVGGIYNNHPKDSVKEWPIESQESLMTRGCDFLFGCTLHAKSRRLMHEALAAEKRALLFPGPILSQVDWMAAQQQSKFTICLEGGGVKCRSHCESPLNSIMAMPDISMHETFPWGDGVNCVRLPYSNRNQGEGSLVHNWGRGVVLAGEGIAKMKELLANHAQLYEIYRNGIENGRRYTIPHYYRHHIGKVIADYL